MPVRDTNTQPNTNNMKFKKKKNLNFFFFQFPQFETITYGSSEHNKKKYIKENKNAVNSQLEQPGRQRVRNEDELLVRTDRVEKKTKSIRSFTPLSLRSIRRFGSKSFVCMRLCACVCVRVYGVH